MALRYLSPLRIALFIALAFSAARVTGCRYLDLVDLRAMDFRLLQRGERAPAADIVIVAIDDASVDAVGRWPWSPALMAKLVDRMAMADPAVIGFDIVWSEPVSPEEDRALVDAVKRAKQVVLGYFFDFTPDLFETPNVPVSTYNLVRQNGKGLRHVPSAKAVRPNLPDLTAAARDVGYFNLSPPGFEDGDGYYRRVPLAIRFGDQVAVALPLAILRAQPPGLQLGIVVEESGVESVRLGSLSIPVAEDGQMLINYRGRGRTFPHIPAKDVLSGAIDPEALHGKLVLVGVTATAVADLRATPFDPHLPGVEIHANVLDNILRRDFLWYPKLLLLLEIPALFLAVLGLGFAMTYVHGVGAAGVAVALLASYLIGSQGVFLAYGFPLTLVYPLLAISLTYAGIALHQFVVVEGEKRRTRRFLELYLSPSLARMLSENPQLLKMEGEKRELTILFSDVRGFTTISEQLDPHSLVQLLNAYLAEMTDVIFTEDGVVRYVGDAIMAVWGAPLPHEDHAQRGCRVALRMLERLHALGPQWQERGWPDLRIGIGLNTGPMIFGSLGSENHLSFEIVGDNANLGARLEGLTKFYRCRIIASEATISRAGNTVAAREIDLVRVKGKTEPVRIFEILGPVEERERWDPLVRRFADALSTYRERRWEDALAAFGDVLEIDPDDGPAALYVARCRAMLKTPPPAEWDGVTVMETK